MLLSACRTVMDDFVDQDWFAETVDEEDAIVKQQQHHIQPHSPQILLENGGGGFFQQQQPLLASSGGGDFLELNVPVDENVFFSAQHQYLEGQQPSLEVVDQGQAVQQSSQPPPVMEQQQQQHGSEQPPHQQQHIYFMETAAQNGDEVVLRQQQQPFYARGCSPTSRIGVGGTDFTVMSSNGRRQNEWTTTTTTALSNNNHQQQQHFLAEDEMPMARIIVRDQSAAQLRPQQNSYSPASAQHFQPPVELRGTLLDLDYQTPCSSNMFQNPNTVPVPVSDQFLNAQLDHQQHQQHHVIRVEGFPQPAFDQCIPPPATDHLYHSSHPQTPPLPQQQTTPQSQAKAPPKKSRSTNNNRKTATTTSSTQQQPVAEQQISKKQQKGNGESKLDQIANMLFSNSNLATVQFDPQQAIEFGRILEETKFLKEQEERGIDVDVQLKACEARIAEFLMVSAVPSPSQQQPVDPPPPTLLQLNGTGKRQTAQKSRPKKKPQPKPPTTQLPPFAISSPQIPPRMQTPQMNAPSIVMPSNCLTTISATAVEAATSASTNCPTTTMLLMAPNVIQTGKMVSVAACSPNNGKLYPHCSVLPSTSSAVSSIAQTLLSSSSIVVHKVFDSPIQQKDSTLSINAVMSQKGTNQRQPKKPVNRKSAKQIAQEKEVERLRKEAEERVRLERERESRRIRLQNKFAALRSSISSVDCLTPFSDHKDCIERLLPFGLLAEPEFSTNFLEQYADELRRHSELMHDRMGAASDRMRAICFREAMSEQNEEKNLLLHLDNAFERTQLQRHIEEAASKNGTASGNALPFAGIELGWEYSDDWNRERYLGIEPFTPSPSPSKIEEEEADEPIEEKNQEKETDHLPKEEQHLNVNLNVPPAKLAAIRIQLQPYETVRKNICEAKTQIEQKEMMEPDVASSSRTDKSENSAEFNSDNKPMMPSSIHQSNATKDCTQDQPYSCHLQKTKLYTRSNLQIAGEEGVDSKVSYIDEDLIATKALTSLELFNNKNNIDNIPQPTEIASSSTQQFVGEEVVEQQQHEQGVLEPMKLKIKIGQKKVDDDEKEEEINARKAEEKAGKEEKKRKKAEKRERKKREKEEERMRRKGREEGEQLKGREEELMDGRTPQPQQQQPSLKITLRRLACWRGGGYRGSPTKMDEHSPQQTSTTSSSSCLSQPPQPPMNSEITKNGDGGGRLKLRISKFMLNNNPKNDEKAATLKENGISEEEEGKRKKKEERKRRKSKKQNETEEEGGGGPSPVKIPKIKIKICGGSGGQPPPVEAPKAMSPQKMTKREQNQPPPLLITKQLEKAEAQRPRTPPMDNCSSPVDAAATVQNNQIHQFSPCCSEEPDDDELRLRTNALFSKLVQD